MKKLKILTIISLIFTTVFVVSGYWLSDDKYFNDLIKQNQIGTPKAAFEYVNRNIDFVQGNPTPVPYTTPRYMLAKRHLWCDEGAMVLAIIVHELGYETRLVDVIKNNGEAGHTYLQVYENDGWVNYDTVLKKSGLTHEQILEGYDYAGLKGYPRPRPYPRFYNFLIQNNFYLKQLALRIRNVPG
ncbi:MAG: transglutaminase domain-containing protein [Pyrinomonadaceae bacterium]